MMERLLRPVSEIHPEEKDYDRAEGLRFKHNGRATFRGDGTPWRENAEAMAKLITTPEKLVRRSKAVVAMYGTECREDCNPWIPFSNALYRMGFSREEINEISKYKRI